MLLLKDTQDATGLQIQWKSCTRIETGFLDIDLDFAHKVETGFLDIDLDFIHKVETGLPCMLKDL